MRLMLLLALMMLSISPSVAFDDAEIMTYASGVLAAIDVYTRIDREELRSSYLAHVPRLGV